MIRTEPLTAHTAYRRTAAGRLGPMATRPPAEMWTQICALLADDRRAIRVKIVLLIVTAVVAAALEVPWR